MGVDRDRLPSTSRGGEGGVTILAGDGAGNVYCLRYVEGDKVTK